ncbi:MAG: lysophospholipase, partial [Acidobacteriaceae bacterium]|nr:lysophospholipase [Acidobacteriaceae bacterium]
MTRNVLIVLTALLAVSGIATPQGPDPTQSQLPPNRQPANPKLPTLYIIGDSTVRNGQGDGRNGQWGWGDVIGVYFDPAKINVVNWALGGRSSRTFITEGHWDRVVAALKPGDFVIMQFGHNDNGSLNDTNRARGTIRGVGDEVRVLTNMITKQVEEIRSFGWYEKQLIAEARAKGATPMVCSLIPRNTWTNGHAARNKND